MGYEERLLLLEILKRIENIQDKIENKQTTNKHKTYEQDILEKEMPTIKERFEQKPPLE